MKKIILLALFIVGISPLYAGSSMSRLDDKCIEKDVPSGFNYRLHISKEVNAADLGIEGEFDKKIFVAQLVDVVPDKESDEYKVGQDMLITCRIKSGQKALSEDVDVATRALWLINIENFKADGENALKIYQADFVAVED